MEAESVGSETVAGVMPPTPNSDPAALLRPNPFRGSVAAASSALGLPPNLFAKTVLAVPATAATPVMHEHSAPTAAQTAVTGSVSALFNVTADGLSRPVVFLPRRAFAVNLPPSVVASRIASVSKPVRTPVVHTPFAAPPEEAVPVAQPEQAVSMGNTPADNPAWSGTTGRKRPRSVRFHEKVEVETYDPQEDEGSPHRSEPERDESFTPIATPMCDVERIEDGIGAPAGVSSPSTPHSSLKNPARVLFSGPESPLPAIGADADRPLASSPLRNPPPTPERGGNVEDTLNSPLLLHEKGATPLVTPAIDRASLLFGDVLQGLFSDDDETSVGESHIPVTALAAETTLFNFEQNSSPSPSPAHNAAATDADNAPPASAAASDSQQQRLPEHYATRLRLLHGVTSQNVFTLLRFSESGELICDSRGSTLFAVPLLERLCTDLASTAPTTASPAVAAKGTREWLRMQLRWVLWTLTGYERRSPDAYLGRLLHWDTVVDSIRSRLTTYAQPSGSAGSCATPRTNTIADPTAAPSSAKRRRPNMYNTVSTALAPPPISSAIAGNAPAPCNKNDVVGTEQTLCGVLAPPSATGPRRSAQQHFSKRGAMSPLQRCSDIACFVWPMVLCFAAPPPSPAVTSGGVSTGILQLTDGWWWTKTQLDAGLLALYQMVCVVE